MHISLSINIRNRRLMLSNNSNSSFKLKQIYYANISWVGNMNFQMKHVNKTYD